MTLIDEEGNLFGLVNVVDALAVLLPVAVVIAESAFVLHRGHGHRRRTRPSSSRRPPRRTW